MPRAHAHPEYIRLIAQGRYDDAYLINWKSNVFLGFSATCDRPCEPACRRVRIEEGSPEHRKREARAGRDLPPCAPPTSRATSARGRRTATQKNGKHRAHRRRTRVADCRARSRAARLRITFDGDPQAGGGAAQIPVPAYRSVIDEECATSSTSASSWRRQRIDSMKAPLTGLRRGVRRQRRAARARPRHSRTQGSGEARSHRHRLVVGLLRACHLDRQARHRARGGNTAMDCCRPGASAAEGRRRRALGLRRDEGLAVGKGGRAARGSIHNFLVPKRFLHEGERVTGVGLDGRGALRRRAVATSCPLANSR